MNVEEIRTRVRLEEHGVVNVSTANPALNRQESVHAFHARSHTALTFLGTTRAMTTAGTWNASRLGLKYRSSAGMKKIWSLT